MDRLIAINPDTCQNLEPEGQEYGYCVFEVLPDVLMIKKVSPKAEVTLNEITISTADPDTDLKINITCGMMYQLQQEDAFCK